MADSAEPLAGSIANSPHKPVLRESLPSDITLESALRSFSDCDGLLAFDSADIGASGNRTAGRYSFLTADPVRRLQLDTPEYGADPFAGLRSSSASLASSDKERDLPPFTGGVAGVLGYELGGCFERVKPANVDEFCFPSMAVGLYDWSLVWNHAAGSVELFVHDSGGMSGAPASTTPQQRRDWVLARLASASKPVPGQAELRGIEPDEKFRFPHPDIPNVFSDFSPDAYREAVARVVEYIRAGDIFQANLSQRLLTPFADDPLELYSRLRRRNAAPYAGLAHFDDWWLLSASPESFLDVRGRDVVTRPIKGTRRRQLTPEADLGVRIELECSDKDRAENVMIVDLLRNDLSRVCNDDSVRVPKLCRLESFATVHHLVSEVTGTLAEGRTLWDLFEATLPGGSISGAPKVRAMEIIAELEPTVRGPYCGNLFYQGFGGQASANILIRTILCRGGWAQLPVGGGITTLSDPKAEYQETIDKAVGMLRALELI